MVDKIEDKKTEEKKSGEKKVEVEKKSSPSLSESSGEAKEEKGADKKKSEYLYAVGRRKSSIAQVRLYKKGKGDFIINEKNLDKYFGTVDLRDRASAALKAVGQGDKLDVTVKVVGGGITGQAEATRHGVARALIQLNPNFRKPLKKAGFLTRDAREKERKKPGLKRARKRPQWQKR